MRHIAVLACAALLACGRDPSDTDPTARFALALENGTEVHAVAGVRSDIVLLVLGAGGRPVTLSLDAAPPFVALDGEVLVVTAERSAEPGTYDVTVTARAGDDSDTRTLRLLLSRTNFALEQRTVNVVDTRGHTPWAAFGPWPGCLSGLRAWGSFFEPGGEQDPARVEVELVPAGVAFTGVATSTSDWLQTRRSVDGGSFLDWSVEIPEVEAGQAYRVAVRGVDALGAATPWWTSPGEVTCTPFALPAFPRRTMTGSLCTSLGAFEFDIAGALPDGALVEAIALPAWATVAISGATVTITMSPPDGLAPWTSFPFELRVIAGGYTASARYALSVC